MRRVTLWLLSTVSVVVLLFGYDASTSATKPLASPPAAVSTTGPGGSSATSGASGGSSGATRTVTGGVASTQWGPVQVQLTVSGGRITGVSVLQQARLAGLRVIGTASEQRFGVVEEFGGTAVVYGDGLEARIRSLAPEGIAAALDCVGTDEAVDVSLALVPKERIVTIAAFPRAQRDGIRVVGGSMPESAAFRDRVRPDLIAQAAAGQLVVPVVRTYALEQAAEALTFLAGGHPGGKLALIP